MGLVASLRAALTRDERGARYHGGLDLLDPSEFLVGFALEPAGGVSRRPPGEARTCPPHRADPRSLRARAGIDEGELLLDAERGLVLRRAELVDGQEAFVREVERIAYDETLPPDTFVFALPPGASARGRAEPQVTTVDAAAALASFRLFKLDPVPPEWRVQAVYVAATERPTLPDSVTLLYSRSDGGERLQIREAIREHELPSIGSERRCDTADVATSRSGRSARTGASRRS